MNTSFSDTKRLMSNPLSTNRSLCLAKIDGALGPKAGLLKVYTFATDSSHSKSTSSCDPRFPVVPVTKITLLSVKSPGVRSTGCTLSRPTLYLVIMASIAIMAYFLLAETCGIPDSGCSPIVTEGGGWERVNLGGIVLRRGAIDSGIISTEVFRALFYTVRCKRIVKAVLTWKRKGVLESDPLQRRCWLPCRAGFVCEGRVSGSNLISSGTEAGSRHRRSTC